MTIYGFTLVSRCIVRKIAFLAYFKDTRMGLWMYSKFDSMLDFLVERWGWTWFKQDDNDGVKDIQRLQKN